MKQVCFEASKHFPLHFFINQTDMAISEVIADIQKVDCKESRKAPLIQRLKTKESFVMGQLTTTSEVGKRRKEAFGRLLDKTYADAEAEADPVTFFHALTHLTREQADPTFVLPILLRTIMPKYQSLSSPHATLMRKAVCHLDIIWYRK